MKWIVIFLFWMVKKGIVGDPNQFMIRGVHVTESTTIYDHFWMNNELMNEWILVHFIFGRRSVPENEHC